MGLFGKSTFLDREVEDWCLKTWVWLMRNFGGMARLQAAPIVLPTPEFFPPTEAVGRARGAYVFERVKHLMGMADWDCALEAIDRPPDRHRVGTYAMVNPGKAPAGLFQVRGGQARIAYASDLVERPAHLTTVFAHELSHYLLLAERAYAPGGEELHELTTDLAVAYTGFGVFGANAAFEFEQHQDAFGQGWRSQRLGYVSDRTWAFALAIYAALRDEAPPLDHLKPTLAGMTRKATRYLERQPGLLAPLRAIA